MSSNEQLPWTAFDESYIWHPYTQMQLFPRATPVSSASGSYLILADGRRIFDGISSWWVTLHAHAHPKIARAIAKQASTLEQVIFAGYTHEPASLLAKGLIDRAPNNLRKVFFSDNGSTAVEVALKMAIQYWQLHNQIRTTILAIEGAYHGDTFGAMSASSRSVFTAPFNSMLFNVVHLPFPYPPENDGDSFSKSEQAFLDALKGQCSSNPTIAAFIYEPLLLGAGGMKIWRSIVLEEALTIIQAYDILAIADEVLTGFGRTGTFFASDTVGRSPDIMTLSKGLTGGFLPLGVTLCTEDIYNSFLDADRIKTFFHGHSYTANPISCVAAIASLSIFDEEPVFDRIETIAQVHGERLEQLATRHSMKTRRIGTVAVLAPSEEKGYLNSDLLPLAATALEKGLLIRPLGDIVYFLPPYSSEENDLHAAYDILEDILKQA